MELIPFEPVDGLDTWYGQLHKPILAHSFKEAGIKGLTPISPSKSRLTSSLQTKLLPFTGPAFWNRMTIMIHFNGRRRTNNTNIYLVTGSQPYQLCTRAFLLPHQVTILLTFPNSTFSLSLLLNILTNSSLLGDCQNWFKRLDPDLDRSKSGLNLV
jgi:hypothetical protein